jgi:membrane protein implicated in regulation of membrane protease activity
MGTWRHPVVRRLLAHLLLLATAFFALAALVLLIGLRAAWSVGPWSGSLPAGALAAVSTLAMVLAYLAARHVHPQTPGGRLLAPERGDEDAGPRA